ncbi:MAG: DUF5908 family protein [Saprospiraceae bacterium]
MPIEIRELHIKVVVPQKGGASAGSGTKPDASGQENGAANEKDEIIAECVEQVLSILKEKSER